MKNLTDFVVSILILIFWLVGYGLMFGNASHGFFGNDLFALVGMSDDKDYAIFAFQVTFAGTAATIVSGAVAERIRFAAYVIVSIVFIGVVYPVSGHWIWAEGGWLYDKGFVDFAGSTVVHSLGGSVGLAGALVLGARAGRFDEEGRPRNIHGQNLVLAVLGVLILWFGWIVFNAGSTLAADKAVALIFTNTMLSAAAGGLGCFLTSLLMNSGKVSIEKMLNGVVGGLISITAGCAVMEPLGAIVMGLMGGVIVCFAEEVVLHVFKIDDPVNVVADHGVAGAWGTLSLAFFAPAANLPLGSASSGLLDTMNAMDQIIKAYNRNLTCRIEIEFGAEGYEIACLFNQLMDYFHDTVFDIKAGMKQLLNASQLLSTSSQSIQDLAQKVLEAFTVISELQDRICRTKLPQRQKVNFRWLAKSEIKLMIF